MATEWNLLSLTYGLLLSFAILFCIYMYRTMSILRMLGVSGPTPLPFVGNLLTYRKGQRAAFAEWRRKYGRVYRIFEGLNPKLVVSDRDMVKQILVEDSTSFPFRKPLPIPTGLPSEGLTNASSISDHRRRRGVLTPAFSPEKLKMMVPLINRCADHLMETLEKMSREGTPFDAKRVFGCFSMDVIASTAFGIDVNSHKHPQDPFVQNAKKVDITEITALPPSVIIAGILSTFLPKYVLHKLGFAIFPADSVSFFRGVLKDIISKRTKLPPDQRRVDLLELMTRSNEDNIHNQDDVSKIRGLSQDEIITQTVAFFVAGYSSSSGLLANVALYLTKNPDVMDKLQHEMASVVKKTGEIQHEDIQRLEYMDMVLMETLRMVQFIRIPRLCIKDTTMKWITVPAGTEVVIYTGDLHMDPGYWKDPMTFNPERFSKEERAKQDPCTFLAFGAGPHKCIGMRLALMASKIALARLLQKYRFVPCPQTPGRDDFSLFDYDIWVKLKQLDDRNRSTAL
ncbi:CYP3A7 [Branchiostoma lanceolatum]|uniref:CYP3A7 protein n=2 Tax=Branchiostoma lanceolatum TaxID=7740 RepID=A0A8J9VBK2_BRALA|nr:CYP3A7 [Branchiostoma lanceolatum]